MARENKVAEDYPDFNENAITITEEGDDEIIIIKEKEQNVTITVYSDT